MAIELPFNGHSMIIHAKSTTNNRMTAKPNGQAMA
jgi:hypothetical protein